MIDQIAAEVWLTLLVLAAASYRITRLIVLDEVIGRAPALDPETGTIVEGDRGTGLRRLIDVLLYDDYGEARNPLFRWAGQLYTCTFCTGFWVSIAVLLVWVNGADWARWGIVGFAVAGAAGYWNSRPGA